MQDRFKFRVFHTPTNSMCDVVCLNCLSQNEIVIANYKKTNSCAYVSWGECIILQCTGLKDKNGRLIFEGDIVKHNNQYIRVNPLIVKYCEDYCGIFLFEPNNKNKYAIYSESIEYEVIGNIYENPELLKEEHK